MILQQKRKLKEVENLIHPSNKTKIPYLVYSLTPLNKTQINKILSILLPSLNLIIVKIKIIQIQTHNLLILSIVQIKTNLINFLIISITFKSTMLLNNLHQKFKIFYLLLPCFNPIYNLNQITIPKFFSKKMQINQLKKKKKTNPNFKFPVILNTKKFNKNKVKSFKKKNYLKLLIYLPKMVSGLKKFNLGVLMTVTLLLILLLVFLLKLRLIVNLKCVPIVVVSTVLWH